MTSKLTKDHRERVKLFEKYLLEHTTLQPSTILKYVGEVKHYFKGHRKLTGNLIKRHVVKQHRHSNNNRTKYAFKHFLEYIGHKEVYDGLPRLKTPVKQKTQQFASPEDAKKVLRLIPKGVHRDMAILQLASGCRSMEVLTMREENVNVKEMSVYVIGKGKKGAMIQFPQELRIIFDKYLVGEPGFLFLGERAEELYKDYPIRFEKYVRNAREKYYNSVQRASKSIGLKFGTHDLRRAFSMEFYKVLPDIRALKEALRHSSINTTMTYLPAHTEEARKAIRDVQSNFFNLKEGD